MRSICEHPRGRGRAHSLDGGDPHASRSLASGRGTRPAHASAPDRFAAARDGRQDESFRAGASAADGERLQLGDVELIAIHTPGHASNCVCYLLAQRAAVDSPAITCSRASRRSSCRPTATWRDVPALHRQDCRLRFRANRAGSRRHHGSTAKECSRRCARTGSRARARCCAVSTGAAALPASMG